MKENIECKPFGIIYRATNLVNGKIYIGQTVSDIDIRINAHRNEAERGKSKRVFQKAIIKYGFDNFKWDIIDWAQDKKELNEKEIYWIYFLHSLTNESGYNVSKGGDGGFTLDGKTDEEKQAVYLKISTGNSGKIRKPETRKAMSKRKEGAGNAMYGKRGELSPHFGKPRNEETKRKISESHKGKIISQEIIDRARETRVKNGNSRGERNGRFGKGHLITGKNNPMYGKKQSPETRAEISRILKEKYASGEYQPASCKSVICINTGEIFPSLNQGALEKYGDKKYSRRIEKSIKQNKSKSGYSWKFIGENNNDER